MFTRGISRDHFCCLSSFLFLPFVASGMVTNTVVASPLAAIIVCDKTVLKPQRTLMRFFLWLADPCYNVFCTKGRMCVINSDFSTTCVCPEACPDDYSPVCSVYLRQFNSTCRLHKFACRVEIIMGIERKGECDLKGLVFSIMHGS